MVIFMKIYIIEKKVVYSRDKDGILSWHANNFHGKWVNKVLGDRGVRDGELDSLKLEKNAYELKWIFKPERNFVIPDKLRVLLKKFKNVHFVKVEFTKLFLFAYRKNDFSLPFDTSVQIDKWFNSVVNDEQLHAVVGDFYELIPEMHDEVVDNYSDLHDVSFKSVARFGGAPNLLLSRSMLSENPVLWSPKGVNVRGDLFDVCESFFLWDYYLKEEVEI